MLLSVSLEAQQPVDRWPADTEKCELSAAGGRISVSALCGTLDAPEDRSDGLHHREDNREDKREDKRDGRTIELAWAVVEARTGDPAPDPVFVLAGGPGQSARDVEEHRIGRRIAGTRLEHGPGQLDGSAVPL